MNIGITGSQGFIGKHLAAALKNKKNIHLSLFDLPENNLLDAACLKNFIQNKDIIIHTAAVNRGTTLEIISGSIVATYNLISEMIKSKSRAKLIFLSSIQAETDTLYGINKKLVEVMLKDFSDKNKAAVSVFRLTNVFGEGCKPFYNSVIATFCYQVANGQELNIENKDKKIDFIYIRDVVAEIIKEIFKKRKKLFYFKRLTLNNEIMIEDLSNLIKSFKNIKSVDKIKSKFHKDLHNTYLSYTNKKCRNF